MYDIDYDPAVPAQLKKTQQWFGSVISVPLYNGSEINPIAPDGQPIAIEANTYIAPSPTLKPYERIQIYNQQYWWRLLSNLQDTFPVLTRLFGYDDFNHSLAIPFLTKLPPNHWSLTYLGYRIPQWIASDYKADDKILVYHAAEIDLVYQEAFLKPHLPPLAATDGDLDSATLYLQPHAHLLHLPFDLLAFRRELLKHPPEFWYDNPLPQLKHEETHALIFRTLSGIIAWKTMDAAEYVLLEQFKGGITIDALCEWLERQAEEVRLPAEAHLQEWFQEWTVQGILTKEQSSPP